MFTGKSVMIFGTKYRLKLLVKTMLSRIKYVNSLLNLVQLGILLVMIYTIEQMNTAVALAGIGLEWHNPNRAKFKLDCLPRYCTKCYIINYFFTYACEYQQSPSQTEALYRSLYRHHTQKPKKPKNKEHGTC